MKKPLLEIRNLKTYFFTLKGVAHAVDGVSLEVYPEETLGIVGESGSGKSVTSLSILQLIESPPGKIVEGEILLDGTNIVDNNDAQMRRIRGREISMIFQEPMTSLNPVHPIGKQIVEAMVIHGRANKKEARIRALELLKLVEIPDPDGIYSKYPHQLSGGMRQRIMIAIALACEPKVLIADEPTTALDVTVQARVLELMAGLKKKLKTSIIMITHDLGVIAEVCDRVAVMYAGQIVEYTNVSNLFERPRHPYTIGLLKSIPHVEKDVEKLDAIDGIVPSPLDFPTGCRFADRCPYVEKLCREEMPDLRSIVEGHSSRCHFAERFGEEQ